MLFDINDLQDFNETGKKPEFQFRHFSNETKEIFFIRPSMANT